MARVITFRSIGRDKSWPKLYRIYIGMKQIAVLIIVEDGRCKLVHIGDGAVKEVQHGS